MKKRHAALLLSLALILSLFTLAGCGASSSNKASDEAVAGGGTAPSYGGEGGLAQPEEAPAPAPDKDGSSGGDDANAGDAAEGPSVLDTEKIIYTAEAQIETTDFDATIDGVYAMIDRYGGFLESSSVTGNNYYSGRTATRSASFVIRVPRESFEDMKTNLSTLGNVPYVRTAAQNITSSYRDTEARLETYRTEETRLLELLEKADTVEDMLTIESRLSEVRYQIESLTSTLTNWDSLINYSTITLSVSEVYEYTEEPAEVTGYWESVGQGFMSTLKSVGKFFTRLFKVFVSALPVLLLLAVITAAVILLVVSGHRRGLRRRGLLPPRGRGRKTAPPPAPGPGFGPGNGENGPPNP